jgi:hypothetical protein
MSDVDELAAAYETAVAAFEDDPGDDTKRVARDRAGEELAAARTDARNTEGRVGVGVVAEGADD